MRSYSIHTFSEVANSRSLSVDTMNYEKLFAEVVLQVRKQNWFSSFLSSACVVACPEGNN